MEVQQNQSRIFDQFSKHKAPEPTCINHPVTVKLVANPEDIKKVSLEHNLQILKKKQARPQDKELDEQKMDPHSMIMEAG